MEKSKRLGCKRVSKTHPYDSFPACRASSRIPKITTHTLTLLQAVLWGGREQVARFLGSLVCSVLFILLAIIREAGYRMLCCCRGS